MARETFLRNLGKVAGFLSPEFHVNGIRLGPNELKQALVRRGIWPLREAVDGFDADNFPDLDPEERRQLERDVETFQESSIPVNGQPSTTEAEGEKALSAFVSILTAMQPYLRGFGVYAALKRQKFPEFVRDFAVKVGEDSTGDPSVWVWVIVDDREAGKKLFPKVKEVRELVTEALDQANIDLYPYIMFRTNSEQIEMEGASKR